MQTLHTQRVQYREAEDVVLPSSFQRSLDLRDGDSILFWEDEYGVHIQNQRLAMERARDVMTKYYAPGRLVSDELLADRRAETTREEHGG